MGRARTSEPTQNSRRPASSEHSNRDAMRAVTSLRTYHESRRASVEDVRTFGNESNAGERVQRAAIVAPASSAYSMEGEQVVILYAAALSRHEQAPHPCTVSCYHPQAVTQRIERGRTFPRCR